MKKCLQDLVYTTQNMIELSRLKLGQFNVTVEINGNCLTINTLNFRIPSIINYTKNHRGSYYFIGSTFYTNQDILYRLKNLVIVKVLHRLI